LSSSQLTCHNQPISTLQRNSSPSQNQAEYSTDTNQYLIPQFVESSTCITCQNYNLWTNIQLSYKIADFKNVDVCFGSVSKRNWPC